MEAVAEQPEYSYCKNSEVWCCFQKEKAKYEKVRKSDDAYNEFITIDIADLKKTLGVEQLEAKLRAGKYKQLMEAARLLDDQISILRSMHHARMETLEKRKKKRGPETDDAGGPKPRPKKRKA